MHPLKEQPRFRALDHPVVVGGSDRHDLGNPDLGQLAQVGALPFGRVVDRPDTDDRPLAGHQPWDRLHRAQRPRVGEGHRRPGEIGDLHLPGTHLADEIFVSGPKTAEIEGLGLLDHGHHQRPAPVRALQVHSQAQVDVVGAENGRGGGRAVPAGRPGHCRPGDLAVDLLPEAVIEGGHGLEGLDNGPARSGA